MQANLGLNDPVGGQTPANCRYTARSTIKCPECGDEINVGTAGLKNLDAHIGGKRCQRTKLKKTQEIKRTNPQLLTGSGVLRTGSSSAEGQWFDYPTSHAATKSLLAGLAVSQVSPEDSTLAAVVPSGSGVSRFSEISTDTPTTAVLEADPSANSELKRPTSLGSEQTQPDAAWPIDPPPSLFIANPAGTDALNKTGSDNGSFQVGGFAVHNQPEMLDPEQADEILSGWSDNSMPAVSLNENLLDVNWTYEPFNDHGVNRTGENEARCQELLTPGLPWTRCKGVMLPLPPECSSYTLYPFQLHVDKDLPWSIHIEHGGAMYLVSSSCQSNIEVSGHQACVECEKLLKNPMVEGIIQRTKEYHENTPWQFLSSSILLQLLHEKTSQVNTMRIQNLAQTRKIATVARNLDDHKRFIMAIGSGRVERVHALVAVGLRNGSSVRALLGAYDQAAAGLYKPRGYSEEETLRTFLLLKLGGARVADIAHRSMNSPSISTARKHAPVAALRASPATPTLDEVVYNIGISCAGCFAENHAEPVADTSDSTLKIQGYVLPFDEMKLQAGLRWDPDTDMILGPCREHIKDPAILKFCSVDQLRLLFDKVNKGEIHLGSEATVAAIGLLSSNSRRSSARPILLSSTCKHEKAEAHAQLINTVISACRSKIDAHQVARLYCVASDGESRRGSALAEITMKAPLSPSSRIYPLLSPLTLMNHLVGDDDLTCDKDYKHVFKRLRNTLLRESGINVFGTSITPALIRLHLEACGMTRTRLDFLMDPNDKQDVPLALSLLMAVWELPAPRIHDMPGFAVVRNALNTLGQLFQLLVVPYIDVTLSLGDQLKYLSAAAHLSLAMFRVDGAQSKFIPVPLYVDIAIMIKNSFYCVAKTQIDNPDSDFWLILLGTDRLETCFGLLRTMIGSDSNADMLQLANRLSNVAVCANILAEHPQWDAGPRRLKLPPLNSRSGDNVSARFDHINPQSWIGNVNVGNVVLSTAWQLGRDMLALLLPQCPIDNLIRDLDQVPGLDILSPFGQLLVKSPTYTNIEEQQLLTSEQHVRPVLETSLPFTGESEEPDLEDVVAISRAETNSELPAPFVLGPNGIKLHKARLLRDAALFTVQSDSKDRLSRIAGRSRYKPPSDTSDSATNLVTQSSSLGRPCVTLNDPAVTLVRCQDRVFLAAIQVTSIKRDSRLARALPVDMLYEDGVQVTFQVLELTPLVEKDPETASAQLDWTWTKGLLPTPYKCAGRFVQPINPVLSTKSPGQPTFLFCSAELQELASSLYAQLPAAHKQLLPVVARGISFPYSISEKACFVCEHEGETTENATHDSLCELCSAPPSFENSQRILEHFGSHILFDPAVDRVSEPCGLCLRPTNPNLRCQFFLSKTKSGALKPYTPQIDTKKSKGCPHARRFSYKTAADFTSGSPCTNVPVRCPRCSDDAPCVWKYNLEAHLRRVHPHAPLDPYRSLIDIPTIEIDAMRRLWDKQVARNEQKKLKPKVARLPPAIAISEEHSSRMIQRVETDRPSVPGVDNRTMTEALQNNRTPKNSNPVSEHSSELEDDETCSHTEHEDDGNAATSHQEAEPENAQQTETFTLSEKPSRYGRVSRKRKIIEQLSTCVCGTKALPQASNAVECGAADCEAKWVSFIMSLLHRVSS
ncbi:hypothetical protein FRC12_011587 [Ceratobasidium sp. 428]|nr:hypothetical protein FRC12_011587 [Ceratobasidium sp. 428]